MLQFVLLSQQPILLPCHSMFTVDVLCTCMYFCVAKVALWRGRDVRLRTVLCFISNLCIAVTFKAGIATLPPSTFISWCDYSSLNILFGQDKCQICYMHPSHRNWFILSRIISLTQLSLPQRTRTTARTVWTWPRTGTTSAAAVTSYTRATSPWSGGAGGSTSGVRRTRWSARQTTSLPRWGGRGWAVLYGDIFAGMVEMEIQACKWLWKW